MVPRRSRLVLASGVLITLFIVWHLTGSWTPWSSSSRPRVPFVPSSTDWSRFHPFHPARDIRPLLSSDTPQRRRLPPVQADPSVFKGQNDDKTAEERRRAVRDEFLRSWRSYKKHAWLRDELKPLTGGWKNTFGGWAATLIDALDTLWIMDLEDDFYEAATAAAALDWDATEDGAANLFETTIRHLGGLLSAYELSSEPALLQKARELGEMLYVAFDTPNRMPGFWFNYQTARDGSQVAGTHDPSAAPASLTLEFTKLSELTGEPKFYDAADRITKFLVRVQNDTNLPGLWPIYLDFREEAVRDGTFSLGAQADSLYEYLPKMHALMSGADPIYEQLYRIASDVAARNLLFRPMLPDEDVAAGLLFAGDLRTSGHNAWRELVPEGQHLTCFAGGMFALGGRLLGDETHVELGAQLARGCVWAYSSFPTGVMPEIFSLIPCTPGTGSVAGAEPHDVLPPPTCAWNEGKWRREGDARLPAGFRNARDPRYILRPEAIESVFVLYRITGDAAWRELAWTMFEAIRAVTTTEFANAAISDVTDPQSPKIDSMESFWLAETLKYFYLIFSPPDVISLDEYVFNTEAHPFRRW